MQLTISTTFGAGCWTMIVADVNCRSVMTSVQLLLGQSGAPATGVAGGLVVRLNEALPFLISESVCGRSTVIINILRNLVQKALSFLEPLPQDFHKALIPLTAFQLRRCLRIRWQRRCDRQPEADEQRQGLDRDAEVAFEPLNLPRQSIEAPRKGSLTTVCAIR